MRDSHRSNVPSDEHRLQAGANHGKPVFLSTVTHSSTRPHATPRSHARINRLSTDQETQTPGRGAPASPRGRHHNTFIVQPKPGAEVQALRRTTAHNDLTQSSWDTQASSCLEGPLISLRPCSDTTVRSPKRTIQSASLRDAGSILTKLNVALRCRVVAAATGGGGLFGCIPAAADQVFSLVEALSSIGFGLTKAKERCVQPCRTAPGRLRPDDRPTLGTGCLVFARRLIPSEE